MPVAGINRFASGLCRADTTSAMNRFRSAAVSGSELECCAHTAALRLRVGSWPRCAIWESWKLSINRRSDERMRIVPPALRAVTAVAAPLAKSAVPTIAGSWSQCMRKRTRGGIILRRLATTMTEAGSWAENPQLHFWFHAASFDGTLIIRLYECHTADCAVANEPAEHRRGPSKFAFDFLFRGGGAEFYGHVFFDGLFCHFARRVQQSVDLAESKARATAAA